MKPKKYDASVAMHTPIGIVELFALEDKLVAIQILATGEEASESTGKSKTLAKVENYLSRYFAGKPATPDFSFELTGTDFQKAVWQEIAKVKSGEITTYAEIAAGIGKPNAFRAVGGAVGANPLPLLIGCHRVLGSSRKITGFSGGDGLSTKRWLLNHEHIDFVDSPSTL